MYSTLKLGTIKNGWYVHHKKCEIKIAKLNAKQLSILNNLWKNYNNITSIWGSWQHVEYNNMKCSLQ